MGRGIQCAGRCLSPLAGRAAKGESDNGVTVDLETKA